MGHRNILILGRKIPGTDEPQAEHQCVGILLGELEDLPPCNFRLLGEKVPSVAVAYAPNSSAALLESVGGVLKGNDIWASQRSIGRFRCSLEQRQ